MLINSTRRHSFLTSLVSMSVLLVSTAASAQVTVSGLLDGGKNAGASVLVGARGFSFSVGLTISEDFPGFGNQCNSDPGRCTAGTTLPVTVFMPDVTLGYTLDGMRYTANCVSCLSGFTIQTSGSVTLPPLAPTATATGRFTLSGKLSPQGLPPVTFSGAGTVTLYLHNPGVPGFPNSWFVDRAVLRLDSPLPEPWASVDVGVVGTAGSTSGSIASDGRGAFDVVGSGGDIWGTSDAFQFAFAYPAGNQIVARVERESATNPFAKAGVMMRSGFTAGAPNVLLDVKPDGGIELLARSSAGASTAFLGGASASFPVWLRLTTEAQQISASISSDGQSWQTVGVVPSFPAAGIGLAVTSHDPSMLNEAMFSEVTVSDSPTDPLSNGWLQTDIGSVSLQGSASSDGNAITVTGDGADIWDTADAFHYVYQQFRNDGSIVARVTALANTSAYAKAGVMIRDTTAAGAAHVLLDVKPDGEIEFMTRTADGQPTTFVAGGFQAMPTWLKLARTGQTYTGSISMDGTSWSEVGSVTLPASTNFSFGMAGLAVTSHDPGAVTTAMFDSITVSQTQGIPVPWSQFDVGAVGTAGAALYDAGTFIVKGAGSDIWGTADSFMFVFQVKNTDPSTLTARVVSESNTSPYAKAGLMLRNGTNASAAFVLIDMKPNGEIEVLQRAADGDPVSYLGGITTGFGTFLRLQRTGATIVVSYSADGSAWTPVVTTTVSMPASASIGLAVTSHDVDQLNTATFDSITGP